jgi:hypothetical protein
MARHADEWMVRAAKISAYSATIAFRSTGRFRIKSAMILAPPSPNLYPAKVPRGTVAKCGDSPVIGQPQLQEVVIVCELARASDLNAQAAGLLLSSTPAH